MVSLKPQVRALNVEGEALLLNSAQIVATSCSWQFVVTLLPQTVRQLPKTNCSVVLSINIA